MAISPDYVLHSVKGIKESIDQGTQLMLDPYKDSRMFNMVSTNEWNENFTATEGMAGVEELTELQTPPTLKLAEGRSVSFTTKRFGGSIVMTEQARVQMGDNTTKVDTFLMRERERLIKANHQLFVETIHDMYNDSASSSSDYLAPDGVEVYGDHTWADGLESWSNYTTSAFSSDAYANANVYAGAVVDSVGHEMPQTWTHIVVKQGSLIENEAKKLFAFGISPVAVGDINIFQGELTIISTPFITTANAGKAYLLALGSEDSPYYVGVNEYPTLREPQLLENEAIRTNMTGFWEQGINKMPINTYAFLATA